MPKLPGGYGKRQSADFSRNVVAMPDPQGDNLGQSLFSAGAQIQEKENSFRFAKAKTGFLIALTKAEAEIDDGDFETYGERYKTYVDDAKKEALEGISSGSDREVFQMESDLMVARGTESMRLRGFAKQKDFERAGLESDLDALRGAALESTDRMQFIDAVEDRVATSIKEGFISAEEGGSVSRQWVEGLAKAHLGMLPPHERLVLLEGSKGEAQYIDADMRQAMVAGAKREIAQQNELIKKEDARIRDAQYEDAFNSVEASGGSTQDIPPEQWESFKGSQKKALLSYSDYLLKEKEPKFDLEAYHVINDLMTSDQNAALSFLKANPDKFTRADYKGYNEKLTAAPEDYRGTETIAAMSKAMVKDLDLNDEHSGKFTRELNQSVIDYKRLNDGKEPDVYELEKMVDRLALETYGASWYEFGSDRQAFEDVEATMEAALKEFPIRYGREPTVEEVARLRQAALNE